MTKARMTEAKQRRIDAYQDMSAEWTPLFGAIDAATKALHAASDACLAKNSPDLLERIVLMTQDQRDLHNAANAAVQHLDAVRQVLRDSYVASWDRQFGETKGYTSGAYATSTPAPAPVPEPEPGPSL